MDQYQFRDAEIIAIAANHGVKFDSRKAACRQVDNLEDLPANITNGKPVCVSGVGQEDQVTRFFDLYICYDDRKGILYYYAREDE